jgi:hypothetical protein
MEERRTAELMSDFDDYEIGGAEPEDSEMGDTGETDEAGKSARKKKKTRQ